MTLMFIAKSQPSRAFDLILEVCKKKRSTENWVNNTNPENYCLSANKLEIIVRFSVDFCCKSS